MRGVWAQPKEYNDVNEDKFRADVQKAAACGLSDIVYLAGGRWGMFYPSSVAPMRDHITGDPIAAFVNECKRLDIRAHVYIPCATLVEIAPEPSWNLANVIDGWPEDTPWFDFENLAAREWLVSIFVELVKKYDLDGIQADYIRYPCTWDYGDWGDIVPRDHTAIPDTIAAIHRAIKNVKPLCITSAAVIVYDTADSQQDWEHWDGYPDLIVPMIYPYDDTPEARLAECKRLLDYTKKYQPARGIPGWSSVESWISGVPRVPKLPDEYAKMLPMDDNYLLFDMSGIDDLAMQFLLEYNIGPLGDALPRLAQQQRQNAQQLDAIAAIMRRYDEQAEALAEMI